MASTWDTPIKEFSRPALNALLYGTNGEKLELYRTNEFGSGQYYAEFEGIVKTWSAGSGRPAASGSRKKLPG